MFNDNHRLSQIFLTVQKVYGNFKSLAIYT